MLTSAFLDDEDDDDLRGLERGPAGPKPPRVARPRAERDCFAIDTSGDRWLVLRGDLLPDDLLAEVPAVLDPDQGCYVIAPE